MKRYVLLSGRQTDKQKGIKMLREDQHREAALTDFAILLGAFPDAVNLYNGKDGLENRTGMWWTNDYATSINNSGEGKFVAVDGNGLKKILKPYNGFVGVRPAFRFADYFYDFKDFVEYDNEIEKAYLDEYPQMITSDREATELESMFLNDELKETGKVYTTDSDYYLGKEEFVPRKFKQYEHNGKKYIRVVPENVYLDCRLSNGREVKEGEPYWIEVQPVRWILDYDYGMAISEKILFAGVCRMKDERFDRCTGDLYMNRYLREVFAKDIDANVKEAEIASEKKDSVVKVKV